MALGSQVYGHAQRPRRESKQTYLLCKKSSCTYTFGTGRTFGRFEQQGAQDFLKICPHAEYVNVTDAAHMVAGDRNDIFAKSVIEFLKRVYAKYEVKRTNSCHQN